MIPRAALVAALLLAAPVASAPAVPAQASRYFSDAEIARGREYARGRRILYGTRVALEAAYLAALTLAGIGAALSRRCAVLARGRRTPGLVLFGATIAVARHALLMPLAFYGGFVREHAYGLSTQTALGWLADSGKGLGLELLIALPMLAGVYLLMCRAPRLWPLAAWILVSGVSVVLAAAAPLVIDPLFNTFRPLPDRELERRVRDLAGKAGLSVGDVMVMDASRRTRRMNAYFSGVGATRRVVLYDTLVDGATRDEVELVLGHELGHWKHGHIKRGLALGAIGSLAILLAVAFALSRASRSGRFGFREVADPASLPLLLCCIFVLNLAGQPIQLAISRSFEAQADRAALELCGKPQAFIASEVSLARTNLSEIEPSRIVVWLLYTHPPVLERISMAEAYLDAR
ncbi:MAG: M48 family metallopeptidase [Acidobacteriota bacterium]